MTATLRLLMSFLCGCVLTEVLHVITQEHSMPRASQRQALVPAQTFPLPRTGQSETRTKRVTPMYKFTSYKKFLADLNNTADGIRVRDGSWQNALLWTAALLPSWSNRQFVQNVPITIFYHIARARNTFVLNQIVLEQVTDLIKSGLADRAASVRYRDLGVRVNLSAADDLLRPLIARALPNLTLERRASYFRLPKRGHRVHDYEFPTLSDLHAYCGVDANRDHVVLCAFPHRRVWRLISSDLHSKGSGSHEHDWRRNMMHFVVERWRECVLKLTRYDAVGVSFRSTPQQHFSGNFWWSTCHHVRSLMPPSTPSLRQLHDRFGAEFWLGMSNSSLMFHCYEIRGHPTPDGRFAFRHGYWVSSPGYDEADCSVIRGGVVHSLTALGVPRTDSLGFESSAAYLDELAARALSSIKLRTRNFVESLPKDIHDGPFIDYTAKLAE